MEARAKSAAERALEMIDAGRLDRVSEENRLFWDGLIREKSEWITEATRGRGCLGRPLDRHQTPIVRWSNHPDSVTYAHYLEERDQGTADSPFACEDYVAFSWTTVFSGVVATECVLLGKRAEAWSVIGYRIEGVADYVQLDGMGRLSLQDPDERGALS